MFRTIISPLARDKDYPERQWTLDIYERILDNALYEHMAYGFHQENTEAGEYIPIRRRRPSIRTNLCRTVVDDSVSLVFDSGHFPEVQCDDEETKQGLLALIKEAKLSEVMTDAATTGASGSVLVQLRILKQKDDGYRAFFKIHSTKFMEPTWAPEAPDELIKVEERYKIKGDAVAAMGYTVPDDYLGADFWFGRDWDDQAEIWYIPWLVKGDAKASAAGVPVEKAPDPDKTVTHRLGFVPMVWVKNLPGKLRLIGPHFVHSEVDGACTFAAAIDGMIEMDYQMSQAGRGLKYSMDPTLMLKEPASGTDDDGEPLRKGPANAIIVDTTGDAKMLEIGGSAFTVVIEYVRAVRELALEAVHGNRADPQKMSSAQSGRAMEMMNQCLIWLAGRLRTSYGEGALLKLLTMVVKAHEVFPLTVAGKPIALKADEPLTLQWPQWHAPTQEDLGNQAATLTQLTSNGLMSREKAVETLAPNYDVEDTKQELAAIEADIKAASDQLVAEQAQIQARTTVPA